MFAISGDLSYYRVLPETSMLTQSKIKELIHYDPDTGICKWICSPSARIKPNTTITCIDSYGYIKIGISYKQYLLHRIIFLYMEGEMPSESVDHINNIRTDNRWSNLRKCTASQNTHNQILSLKNALGIKGLRVVDYGYRAQVKYKGKKYTKRFKGITETSKLAAIDWLHNTRITLHQDYANNG